MARYIQKISLRPYSDTEIWAGWELEGRDGEVEGTVAVAAFELVLLEQERGEFGLAIPNAGELRARPRLAANP